MLPRPTLSVWISNTWAARSYVQSVLGQVILPMSSDFPVSARSPQICDRTPAPSDTATVVWFVVFPHSISRPVVAAKEASTTFDIRGSRVPRSISSAVASISGSDWLPLWAGVGGAVAIADHHHHNPPAATIAVWTSASSHCPCITLPPL